MPSASKTADGAGRDIPRWLRSVGADFSGTAAQIRLTPDKDWEERTAVKNWRWLGAVCAKRAPDEVQTLKELYPRVEFNRPRSHFCQVAAGLTFVHEVVAHRAHPGIGPRCPDRETA